MVLSLGHISDQLEHVGGGMYILEQGRFPVGEIVYMVLKCWWIESKWFQEVQERPGVRR